MNDCLFCLLAAGDIPADIVYSDDRVVAFRDVNPQAPTHVLVIPREHYADVAELTAADPELLGLMARKATEVAAAEHLVGGYRLVINTGPDAGQTVNHLHVHLLGGRHLSWPPG